MAKKTTKKESPQTSLVIVESPAKVRTISRFLGDGFVVEASIGHVLDLPRRNPKGVSAPVPGIDLENKFSPSYETIQGKKKVLSQLKKAARGCKDVWLATDLDREGEAIAWLLAEALDLKPEQLNRVVFNAITRTAIERAFQEPRQIDMAKVNAQQARRILDRIVGYQVSPLLWKKVAGGLSAGRVQSVAVRLVVEREKLIRAHVPDESWSLTARLALDPDAAGKLVESWAGFMASLDEKGKPPTIKRQNAWLSEHGGLTTELVEVDGEKFKLGCSQDDPQDLSAEISRIAEAVGMLDVSVETVEDESGKGPARHVRNVVGQVDPQARYQLVSVETRRTTSRPSGPFITSTLQMSASNALGFTASRTMRAAQGLYEGVNVPGEGHVGLITYMRTDSTSIAGEAIERARGFIGESLGDSYLPEKPRFYGSTNKNAQEAHEAIRPTDVNRLPEQLAGVLNDDQLKLYRLIRNRFLACQMTDAQWDATTILLERSDSTTGAILKSSGRVLVFDGFYKASGVPTASDEQTLPALDEGHLTAPFAIDPKQKFSSPPARFNEGSLVKKLEEEGIGRPSTYASIIKVIQDRNYVEKRTNRFYATDLGEVVTEKLIQGFPGIMDLGYTRWMEEQLDGIEDGEIEWTGFLQEFYDPFKAELDSAHETMTHARAETKLAPKEYLCPDCGRRTEYRFGRNGKFLSCTGFVVPTEPSKISCPECKATPMGVNRGKTARSRPFLTCSECEQKVTWSKITKPQKEAIAAIAAEMREPCRYAAPIDAEGRPILPQVTNIACPGCEDPLIKKTGRYGPFLACSNYPECDGIVNLDKQGNVAESKTPPLETDLPCSKCDAPLYLRNGKRGPWLGCSKYPRCRGRGAWKGMEDDERARWEKLLAEHEKEHPAAIIKTVEGLVIQAGFEPVLLDPTLASS
ncbi:MAG: type I DNA topoisomerase [Planctomycetota bacterium]|nr:type I DNA topoisomerase [Planctomycetota bacterium]